MKKVALVLALLPLSVLAQSTVPSAAFDAFMWQATGGGQQTIAYGANGTPILSPSSVSISSDGGMPRTVQSGLLKNSSGNTFPVTSAASVSASGLRSAAFAVVKHSVGPVLLGVALWDLAKEIGFYLTRNSDGSLGVEKEQSNVVQVWTSQNHGGSFPSAAATCAWIFTVVGGVSYVVEPGNPPYSNCKVFYGYGSTQWNGYTMRKVSESSEVVRVPSNDTELVDAIAVKSGWPSTSHISRLLADPNASKEGKIQLENPVVSGAATSLGKVTTTNNTTNNTTKTETVTHNHTYEGAKVNTTTTTTTVVTNNIDNSVVSNEVKTDTPAPLPEPVEDVCQKNPEIIGCSKYGTPVASDVLVEETVAVTITPVAFVGSASCPGPINFNVSGHQYAVAYTPLCEKLAVLKYLFLAMAGFVAAYIVASMFKV